MNKDRLKNNTNSQRRATLEYSESENTYVTRSNVSCEYVFVQLN